MKILSPDNRDRSLQRGSLILAVFWVMAVMGVALVASMRVVSYQTNVVNAQLDGVTALQYAERGVAIATNRSTKPWTSLLEQNFEEGGFKATLRSNGGRFNLNTILLQQPEPDKELLRRMFTEWGMDVEDAEVAIDSLVDWVDRGELEEFNGAEERYYQSQGQPLFPYNRPFHSLDEARLVRGMDVVEAYNPNWRDWFTLWSSGKIDLSAASPEIIRVAIDGSREDAQRISEHVDGPDGIRFTEDDNIRQGQFPGPGWLVQELGLNDDQGLLANRIANAPDRIERIESEGFVGTVRRRIVLLVQNRRGNPQILDRREEFVK